jgi:IclR family pca regulon transcriptional regulator
MSKSVPSNAQTKGYPSNLSSSLARGLKILGCFSESRPDWGVTELASELEVSKSTIQRYVNTLNYLNYLEQDPSTRRYRLGLRAIDLGLTALGGIEVRKIALPHLEQVATSLGHTVNMAILEGHEIVYVERIAAEKNLFDLNLHVGSRLPAYCTSMGKAQLAYLPDDELEVVIKRTDMIKRGPNTFANKEELKRELQGVRKNGFAINNEELAPGLRSAAVPIRSHQGSVVAAINVAMHSSMRSMDEIVDLVVPALMSAAERISSRLGYLAAPQEGFSE